MAKGGSAFITPLCALVFGGVQFHDAIVGAGSPVFKAGAVRAPQRLYMFDIAREQRRHSAMLTTLNRRRVYTCGQSTPSGAAEALLDRRFRFITNFLSADFCSARLAEFLLSKSDFGVKVR